MADPRAVPDGHLREDWAARFAQQAHACAQLGSDLYGRLLALLADELAAGGSTWELLRAGGDLRFGQAAPLRLVGAAHRLALSGAAPEWAALLPSCGGTVPSGDEALLGSWRALVERHRDELEAGLAREVQTNEVARSAGLALAIALSDMSESRLVELGCSAGLNLRLDRFAVDLGGIVLGHAESRVQLRPAMLGRFDALRHQGLVLPAVTERVGIDPHPIDPATPEGALTVRSFVWPDQLDRLALLDAAIAIAAEHPAELIPVVHVPGGPDREHEAGSSDQPDTATVLGDLLAKHTPTVVMESIVWQYIPPAMRWRITEEIETAGESATSQNPLVWVRYEPDEWDRRRAAIWSRAFPGGSDQLVAHVDYHARWISIVAPPRRSGD